MTTSCVATVFVSLFLAVGTAPALSAEGPRFTTHRIPEAMLTAPARGATGTLSVAVPSGWARVRHPDWYRWFDQERSATVRLYDESDAQYGAALWPTLYWQASVLLRPADWTLHKLREDSLALGSSDTWPNFGLIGDAFLRLPIGRVWRLTWIEWALPMDNAHYYVWSAPMVSRTYMFDRGIVTSAGKRFRAFYQFEEFCPLASCREVSATFERIRRSLELVPRRRDGR